jgi:hypothetical protein
MGRKRVNSVTDEQICEAYKRLRSMPKVMAELGVGCGTVSRVLEKNGIPRTGRLEFCANRKKWEPGTYPGVYKGSAEDIVAMYQSGMSIQQVAQKIGRSVHVVHRRVKAAGVARPWQGSGKFASGWVDGRQRMAQGYVRIWVADDDPMASMRNRVNTVLEHRLVMARHLGRPLRPSETVHHINGKNDDNRIENLQLRQGKHGKHVRMCCLNCGSHNVGPIPL